MCKDGEKCDTTADDYGPSSGLTYKTRESCYNRCKGMGAALMYKHWRVDATCNADGCYCRCYTNTDPDGGCKAKPATYAKIFKVNYQAGLSMIFVYSIDYDKMLNYFNISLQGYII